MPLTIEVPDTGTLKGQEVVKVLFDEKICGVKVSDILEAGAGVAAEEARYREVNDNRHYFFASHLGTEDSVYLFLERDVLAQAYNGLLDRVHPAGVYGRNPVGPQPMIVAPPEAA